MSREENNRRVIQLEKLNKRMARSMIKSDENTVYASLNDIPKLKKSWIPLPKLSNLVFEYTFKNYTTGDFLVFWKEFYADEEEKKQFIISFIQTLDHCNKYDREICGILQECYNREIFEEDDFFLSFDCDWSESRSIFRHLARPDKIRSLVQPFYTWLCD